MTREEALLKLIAVEPIPRAQIVLATGWPVDETLQLLEQLRQRGAVTYTNRSCTQWYSVRAQATSSAH